jgi:uncharacterized protein (TIGR03086 family)
VDLLDGLDLSVAEFRRRLVAVDADDWTRPTPCDGWDVRYLVAHVVGGNLFAHLVLNGATTSEAMAVVMSGSLLGDDPVGAYDEIASQQRGAFRAAGALDAPVDHPAGSITGRDFLELRVFDVTVHAWDLARAIDGDEELDPALANAVLDVVTAMADGPGFGIEPLGEATSTDSPQVRLLDLSGRR